MSNGNISVKIKSKFNMRHAITALFLALSTPIFAQSDLGTLTLSLKEVYNKQVSLSWNNPETLHGLFDDIEDHTDFTINSPGTIGWQYIDADNENTYTWTATDFPNQGKPMAFIVFNPSKTSPSTEEWPDIKPYSGKKMLIDFTVDGGNNDYLISPELSFDEDFQFSFQARSYTESYGKERFRVGYSTTGTNASDFTFIQEGDYEEVPAAWTLCRYTIPKEAKYVCLNCVSQEAFMFMVDDIFIGTNIVRPQSPRRAADETRLCGFNLYRNGNKVNSELINGTNYTDSVAEYGTYSYSIEAIMTDGSVGTKSEQLSVEVPDIRLLPFEDDFDSDAIDTDKWSMPTDEAGHENQWKRDYYAYGLVDYSACYPYSSIGNDYSQSLVSRELRTQDASNTYLRFQVRLDNNPKYTDSYLSAEVSADGGLTWSSLVDIANDEGTFAWRTYEFSLTDVLGGAEFFYVRFRAHGANSWEINYWYVDDVKVWCPQTKAATVSVQSMGAPVAGADITLTADHGAVYTGTSDSQGTYNIPRLEYGDYTVEVEADGYDRLEQTLSFSEESSSNIQLTMLRPVLSWQSASIEESIPQESKSTRTLTLSNSGDGEAFWTLTPKPEALSGDTARQFEPGPSFDASGDLQSSVAFDGEYFYTASTYTLGRYYKYDKEGRFIEEFTIPGMYYKLYDLAYDGTYFYGSDYSNCIYQLDFRNKRLVRSWEVLGQSSLDITHITYDPNNDQFWVGSWTTLGRVDRNGNVTVNFFNIGGSSDDIAVMGSAYDNVSEGGPFLWFSNLAYSGTSQIDKLQLLQYDISNRRLTRVEHTATDVIGYKIGTTEVPNNIGGIELTTLYEPGQLTMVGILIQSPSRIYTYRMADFDSWYKVSPMSGTISAGETATLNVDFDAIDFSLGETRTANLSFGSLPTISSVPDVTLTLTASTTSKYPRPVNLTAVSNDETYSVALSWEAAAGSKPTSYLVMRDSTQIATVTDTKYEDTDVVRGTYSYTVVAQYGDSTALSVASDSVCVTIKKGVPYFAPLSLEATLESNKTAMLSWQSPDAKLKEAATLRWDNGSTDNGFGLSDGGYFYAGIVFDASDLEPYRDMTIKSVDVFIKERVTALSLRIYKDGKSILNQRVSTSDIKYGEFNTVELNSSLTIERGCEYRIAFMIMHDADLLPLGVSSGTTEEGKSNLMSENGVTWYPASYAGFSNQNFNIAMNLEPADDYSETLPTAYRILRDGQEVGQSATTSFSDDLSEPATYTYQVVSLYGEKGESASSNSASVTVEDIGEPIAPKDFTASLARNRNVSLRWGFPISGTPSVPVDLTATAGTSPDSRPEYVSQFRGAFTGEYGVASDGNYIYTTRHSVAGTLIRYQMDGTLDQSIGLATTLDEGFRDITYDGTNFWTVANGSEMHQLDLSIPDLTDTRSVSEVGRHITYVPTLDNGRGGFEVGDWDTSIFVSMQGAKLGDGPTLSGAAGSAYYDGVLYTFEQGYETAYELCARDITTGELLWHTSIAEWSAVEPQSGSSAGGLSLLQTKEGLSLLCLALQESAGTRFLFFDLGSVRGLEGYNIYRNGTKINTDPVPHRYYSETLTEPGDYTYQIQTVYIDGSLSALSDSQIITILPATTGDAPTDIKAKATTAGYDVNISIVDPTTLTADQFESFENGMPSGATGFVVNSTEGYSGNCSLEVPEETAATLVLPISKTYDADFALSLVACNTNDDEGAGTIRVYTSSSTDNDNDFVSLTTLTTTEAWCQYQLTLPAQTRYLKLSCPSAYASQLIDAVSINATQAGQIYGYDIMRDGQQLNGDEPVSGVTYTDHNLMPGTYSYQVRAYYDNASVSDWSSAVEAVVDYTNGYQAPGQLSVTPTDEGYTLSWTAPALSGVKELKWHNGVSYSAAGMPSGGSYYAGVQFDTDDLADYASLSISQVSFYVNQVPTILYVQLYQGTDLVFEKYVPTLKQYSMNTVYLDKPIRVNAQKSLRAVVYVEHNSITVPLGYDEGPARTGRGDLYSSDGTTWSTLTDNDIDGNWNITIGLQPYASDGTSTSSTVARRGNTVERYMRHSSTAETAQTTTPTTSMYKAPQSASSLFDGYNVYCNGDQLNESALSVDATQYTDSESHKGRYYEYQVKAIYPDYGEVGSNVVRVMVSDIDGVSTDETDAENPTYTVSGVRTTDSQRGIVIQKGRKHVNNPHKAASK